MYKTEIEGHENPGQRHLDGQVERKARAGLDLCPTQRSFVPELLKTMGFRDRLAYQ